MVAAVDQPMRIVACHGRNTAAMPEATAPAAADIAVRRAARCRETSGTWVLSELATPLRAWQSTDAAVVDPDACGRRRVHDLGHDLGAPGRLGGLAVGGHVGVVAALVQRSQPLPRVQVVDDEPAPGLAVAAARCLQGDVEALEHDVAGHGTLEVEPL